MSAALAPYADAITLALAAPGTERGGFSGDTLMSAAERAGLERLIGEQQRRFEDWKAKLPVCIAVLDAAFKDPDNEPDVILRFAAAAIAALDAKLKAETVENAALEKSWRKAVRAWKSRSKPQADWLHRQVSRLSDLQAKWRNERVRLYYDLIALRAEHDPSARGGPRYDTADEFLADLIA